MLTDHRSSSITLGQFWKSCGTVSLAFSITSGEEEANLLAWGLKTPPRVIIALAKHRNEVSCHERMIDPHKADI
jgi:hypothetical protein